MLVIDHLKKADFELLHGASADQVVYFLEETRLDRIREIDLSKIELLPLVDEDSLRPGLTQAIWNQFILNRLQSYKRDGYLLLDRTIVANLLTNPEQIPSKWGEITEADSSHPSTIRFDGSIFYLEERPSEELVLAPFKTGYNWVSGFTLRVPKLPDPRCPHQTLLRPELTAAIRI